ncbi:MAG TPA: HD domain-containing protein [Anaerolineae bacterium]
MVYHDSIYGPVKITEPVLLDLIEAEAVQRLRGVLQHGISGLIGVTSPITRFEHSVGAMLLVRRLGGPVVEQIAALLHDVSHTAFSHVIDYVFNDHDGQSYHDEMKAQYMASTDLPQILAAHGYDWTDFLDEARFPLLEQPSPRLCADRLDYFLRDGVGLGLATEADIHLVLDHLIVAGSGPAGGRIASSSLEVARWLGYTYMAADDASWANFREVGLYEVTARAIRTALRLGALTEADFWDTDEPVWARLQAHGDPELQAQVRLVSPQTRFVWDEAAPTFWVSTKLRTIVPDVLLDGELRPLSSLDPDFARARDAYLSRKGGKWPVRVITGD